MAANTVALDALIPREDFAVETLARPTTPLDRINVIHLEGHFFGSLLRKPDFQRETNQWTPQKVADLVKSFLDLDLIPAVILWKSGQYYFVVDGAHRLSALMAWIADDYGDRQKSMDYFGGRITQEQRRIAERTRKLVNKTVGGSYAEYVSHRKNPAAAPPHMQARLSNLGDNSIIAQWVPATDAETAEKSFFKINQAATPIDPTEKRILKSRRSASAIAARAITHGGTGHKYWFAFEDSAKAAVETLGREIFHALYDPPLDSQPLTTLDVPVAGRGYSALPFVFDLVNHSNGIDVADTTAKATIVKDTLPDDPDGAETVRYLKVVQKRLARLTGNNPSALGLHPVVYFYTRSGAFQPTAFLAASLFFEELAEANKLLAFTEIRARFEQFLIDHKVALSLLTHKYGSGGRSLPWIKAYLECVAHGFWSGKSGAEIQTQLANDPNYAFLTVPRPAGLHAPSGKERKAFNTNTKTAAFFALALPSAPKCAICQGLVHKNSVQFDHVQRIRDGGGADVTNAQVTHPYCNSTYKERFVAGGDPVP